jgi:hypothetical protein
MGFSSSWSVEAKEFEVVVVGGESGVRIRESCKGRHRSILLDRSELAWLIKTFESLVCVEDSRVFWDQSRYGFPRIIAQRHFNGHGGFMVIEEFTGIRRKDSIFIPEGRAGKGWIRFREELRLVSEFLRAGSRDREVDSEVPAIQRGRRSYAEVLAKTASSMEAPFGEITGPVARVPRWVRERSVGYKGDLHPAKSDVFCLAKEHHALESLPAKRICSEEKNSHAWAPEIRQRVPMQTVPKVLARKGTAAGEIASVPDTAPTPTAAQAGPSVALGRSSDTRHGVAEATFLPAARNNHSGESFDVGALRESLERMQKEIDFWLKGLALVDGGGLGRAASSRARMVGFKVARPKSKPKPKSKTIALSKSARASKGKGILDCPDQAMEWRAKVDPVFRPPWAYASSVHSHGAVSTPGLDAGILTPGASSSSWDPALGHVVASSSLDGQLRSPVRESSALVSVGTEPAARGNESQYSPQSLVADCQKSTPSLGVGEGQFQGQSKFLDRCFSPLCSSEVQVEVEAVQWEEPGLQRVGELVVGSSAAGDEFFSEQEQLNCSKFPVLCLDGGLVRVKDSALSQLRSVDMLSVPRELTGNVFGHQSVDMEIVPCFGSARGEGSEWMGGPVVESVPPGLQVGLLGEASSSISPGEVGLVEFKEGGGAVVVGSPLNAYSLDLGGLGYSDWVMQSANEIYPIVGMTFVGHKLQLLAFLTCIEEERKEERRLGKGRTKGKREIRNLESSINYDAKGSGVSSGKRRARGLVVVP